VLKKHENQTYQWLGANIKRKTACLSQETAQEFFSNFCPTLLDVPACNILHYDEISSSDDSGKCRLIFKKFVRYFENIVNFWKYAASIMIFGSADFVLLPLH
jgi:hypothetical protein